MFQLAQLRTSATARRSILLLSLVSTVCAADEPKATGEAIYRYCISCHGERGEGGENGKHPRIAGLPARYVNKQLHDFKSQQRTNKPMLPIFKHHRFDETVIDTVANHIAAMPVPDLALWPYQPSPAAIEAFGSKQQLAEAGMAQYQSACADCHGLDGAGTDAIPPLIHQYPRYLSKQMSDFAADRRSLPDGANCAMPDQAQSEAVLNHLVELGKD